MNNKFFKNKRKKIKLKKYPKLGRICDDGTRDIKVCKFQSKKETSPW